MNRKKKSLATRRKCRLIYVNLDFLWQILEYVIKLVASSRDVRLCFALITTFIGHLLNYRMGPCNYGNQYASTNCLRSLLSVPKLSLTPFLAASIEPVKHSGKGLDN